MNGLRAFYKGIAFCQNLWYCVIRQQDGWGQLRKGGPPMSLTEVLALLTLMIAVFSLGYRLGKDIKKK